MKRIFLKSSHRGTEGKSRKPLTEAQGHREARSQQIARPLHSFLILFMIDKNKKEPANLLIYQNPPCLCASVR